MVGDWGDWIALWGLINMLEIPVAIVSSLGETGLNVIYPAVCHGIIFLFFVLLSLVCFVSVNYLVLMYCRIEL